MDRLLLVPDLVRRKMNLVPCIIFVIKGLDQFCIETRVPNWGNNLYDACFYCKGEIFQLHIRILIP